MKRGFITRNTVSINMNNTKASLVFGQQISSTASKLPLQNKTLSTPSQYEKDYVDPLWCIEAESMKFGEH